MSYQFTSNSSFLQLWQTITVKHLISLKDYCKSKDTNMFYFISMKQHISIIWNKWIIIIIFIPSQRSSFSSQISNLHIYLHKKLTTYFVKKLRTHNAVKKEQTINDTNLYFAHVCTFSCIKALWIGLISKITEM